jgi:hypothetical protein
MPNASSPARAFNQLAPRPVTWLWPGRLPLGKLSLLEGDPQLGKSLLTLDLCARLSTGRPWPDGTPSPGPAPALIVNGEDGDEDTVLPRLQALGADLGRCFLLERQETDLGPPLSLPSQTNKLEAALAQTGAQLVVIDPIVVFLAPGVNMASDQGVRRALRPLARLAERYQAAILLSRHLNKGSGRRALYRGLGSIGLVAACRAAWLAAADPRTPGRVVLAQVKNNLAPPQPSLAYEVRPVDGAGPTICWLGPTDWTADALLAAQGPAQRPSLRDSACAFLADALAEGPRRANEIWDKARALGLSDRTVRRAREVMHLVSLRRWEDGRVTSYWALPGQELPVAREPDGAENELDRYLREMRERFAPPNPLDDD